MTPKNPTAIIAHLYPQLPTSTLVPILIIPLSETEPVLRVTVLFTFAHHERPTGQRGREEY